MMRDSVLLSTIGGATALGLGYLLYSQNKSHSPSPKKPSIPDTFQIIQQDEVHPDQHPEQTMSAGNVICLYQMASDLTYLFDIFGVNAWVSGGALLGTIRHAGLIPWEPVLDFFAYTRDEAALGQLFSTNTLAAYGYQAIPLPNEGGWMFYMGANPEVKTMLFWVEPADDQPTCPSGDLYRNSSDPQCDISLKFRDPSLMRQPHYGSLPSVAQIEPRRKFAFGMTEVYVPSQYEAILERTEGTQWRTQGDDPSFSPADNLNREVQRLPWYRPPRVLSTRDYKPATPIGPLKFADRAITKYSRDVDIKGKYNI